MDLKSIAVRRVGSIPTTDIRKVGLMTHIVVLKITPEVSDLMNDEEIANWVQEHFKGCEYGGVKVLSSLAKIPDHDIQINIRNKD
jgi:hypothetical protein